MLMIMIKRFIDIQCTLFTIKAHFFKFLSRFFFHLNIWKNSRLSHSGLIPKNPKKNPRLPNMASKKFQQILIIYEEYVRDSLKISCEAGLKQFLA